MRLLRLLFLIALLIGVGAAGFYFLGEEGPFRRQIAETQEDSARDAALPDAPPPAFDVVRVEETGTVVAAGTAPPGWTVRIETPERILGEVTSEFDGTWVFIPDTPLPEGDHSLSLLARAPDGAREVAGAQRVAVSVSSREDPALVALSEDDKPTRILQSGVTGAVPSEQPAAADTPQAPAASEPEEPQVARAEVAEPEAEARAEPPVPISFSAVDYEDQSPAGRLSMSGKAAAGARIALYLNNRFIGSAETDASGAWTFTITEILEPGAHMLRADHVDLARGDVLSRAEVPFDHASVDVAAMQDGETQPVEESGPGARSAPETAAAVARPPAEAQTASLAAGVSGSDADPRSAQPEPRRAATAQPQTDATPARPTRAGTPPRRTAIVVRRGDTLWHIARRHYGSGVRYTQIFRSNRDQIRNPHRIYPGQRFDLPR